MKSDLRTLDDLITERYGERGTPNRERFERGSRRFKADYLREMRTYTGAFPRLPGEVVRHTPRTVKLAKQRISLLVRLSRRKSL
ncbi:MAG: hypothetical protein ABL999_06515 [Pyrinomonadaceae bacterium]